MKKTFTLFSLFVFLSFAANAQQVLFSENFDGYPGYNITNWTLTNTPVNADPWSAGLPYLIGGACFTPPGHTGSTDKIAGLVDQTCTLPNHEDDVFMYSPAINFSNISDAWLRFDSYFLHAANGGKTECGRVEVSTDNGATWNIVYYTPAYTYGFKTWYVDLSAYAGNPNVRIGFRYSDSGQVMRGWMVDNIAVFAPTHLDLSLLKITPEDSLLRYSSPNDPVHFGGTVYNAGIDTIHAFDVKYQLNNGAITSQSFSGLNIPAFNNYDFTFTSPAYAPGTGIYPVKMWVQMAGDTAHHNDTLLSDIRGMAFRPYKRLVVEEGTATWNKWSPRGMVWMDSLKRMAAAQDIDVCQISVHDNGDPMRVADYQTFLYELRYYYVPYFLFDRRENVDPDSFFVAFNKQKNYFGFADLELSSSQQGNALTVVANVKPAIDMHCDCRVALIITEDDVQGPSPDYDQKNNYAGGSVVMGGFENKPDPVPAADMHYNFVARNTAPSPAGQQGILPLNMSAGGSYPVTIETTLDNAWDKSKLHATAILVRYDDSTILNGNHIIAPLAVPHYAAQINTISLYPNPAADYSNLRFELTKENKVAITVTDITGKTLYATQATNMTAGAHELTIPTTGFANGIYFVNLKTTSGNETIKLQVMR